MQINITDKTAKAIILLDDRYYFDLFKSIRADIEEEYIVRDAINAIAKEIKKQWQQCKTDKANQR